MTGAHATPSPATDTVIVGGGIAGLAAAVELAERGARVTVLEKDDLGFEQSGRSTAAIWLPGPGAPAGGAGDLTQLAAYEWDRFEERHGCGIELNREGRLSVAVDAADSAFFERHMARSEHDPDRTTLRTAAARERFPTLRGPFAALELSSGGHVNPLLTLRALHDAGLRHGVDYRVGVVATGFETNGARVVAVRTSAGRIPCERVVIAAGAWAPRLLDKLGVHVPHQRVRVPVGVTGPAPRGLVPGVIRAGAFGARQNGDSTIRVLGGYRVTGVIHDLTLDDLRDLRTWGPALFAHRRELTLGLDLRVLRDDVLRLLGDERRAFPRGYEPKVTKRSLQGRLDQLARLIPALAGARIQRWFAGVVELTPDFEPAIGALPSFPNAHALAGFSGHGFILGPGAARALAEAMSEGRSTVDLSRYRPDRFADGASVRTDALF